MYIQVGGGLGNQLFIWHFAHLVNLKFSKEVKIVYTIDNKTPKDRQIEIAGLIDNCNHNISINETKFLKIALDFRDKFKNISSKTVKSIDKLFHIKEYDSSKSFLEITENANILRGSFVNSTYLNLIINQHFAELVSYLDTLNLESLKLPQNNFWQTLHIRRGDLRFQSSPKIIDINSIRHLISPNLPLIITTDDNLIKEELKRKFPSSFVIDSKDASPWQALAIMARSSRLIATNSTLSWWACAIGKQRNIEIYAPSIWMQENLGMSGINYYDTVFESL